MGYCIQSKLSNTDFNSVVAIEAFDALFRALNLFLEEAPIVLVFVTTKVRHVRV